MSTAAIDSSGTQEQGSSRGLADLARRRPLAAFLRLAFGIGIPLLTIPAVAGIRMAPFLLVLVYVALLAPALFVTRSADGRAGMRRLLSRTLIWRFGVGRWAVILLAMPVLTLGVAAASGTLETPESSWASVATSYLLSTLIVGALILNVWEETAWGGFVQTRLTARHGLLKGALLTAPLFAAIHIPLQFDGNWTWSEVGIGMAVVFAASPFYRYLLGMHLLDTRGSLLAIGIQHAAWNASGNLDGVDGDWQAAAGAVLLTLLVALGRKVRSSGTSLVGLEAEKAAAEEWLEPSAHPAAAP